jgi:hypothetical protein
MTGATLLLRQVHPSFVQDGRVTSQAFRPTPKVQSLLSVYDGDLITTENSWRHFTSQDNCTSAGVLAATFDECTAEGLTVRPDPEPFPEHAVIDFTGCSANQIEKKSKKLKAKAESRGWQYQPPQES